MDCKSTKTLVQDYLSGNMDDETCMDFIQHVNTCPSCYEELETYFAINRVLSYLEDGEDDASQSYNMRKLLTDDLKKNEKRIRRTRTEHMIFAVSMTAAEAALVFTVILKYLPSLYELISGGLRWFGGL
jgi:hypothetical protein